MAHPRSSSPADAGTRRGATNSLALRPQPGRPLTKKQQAFNRLVTAVERARARVDAARRRFDAALVFHAAHVRPRVERVIAARKEDIAKRPQSQRSVVTTSRATFFCSSVNPDQSTPFISSGFTGPESTFWVPAAACAEGAGRFADAGCTVDILLVDGERDQNGLLDKEAEIEAALAELLS